MAKNFQLCQRLLRESTSANDLELEADLQPLTDQKSIHYHPFWGSVRPMEAKIVESTRGQLQHLIEIGCIRLIVIGAKQKTQCQSSADKSFHSPKAPLNPPVSSTTTASAVKASNHEIRRLQQQLAKATAKIQAQDNEISKLKSSRTTLIRKIRKEAVTRTIKAARSADHKPLAAIRRVYRRYGCRQSRRGSTDAKATLCFESYLETRLRAKGSGRNGVS
eukprot:SAG11_NODE_99_length_16913_cov_41.552813_15_plen_220_part_00